MKARLATALLLLLTATQIFANAKITIVNKNAAGVGFNDPTPATPVGGNPGTTLGQQRLIAFQTAADLWAQVIDSPVEIIIQASFEPLTCDATSGTLGSAGPLGQSSDFANAPFKGTWYVSALANKLAGRDLQPGTDDIRARFNSNIGTANCLPTMQWYLGLDGNHGADIDLVVVLLHEFGHGLGFINFVDPSTGQWFAGQPDVANTFTFDTSLGLHWSQMTDAQRLASATSGSNLVWDGPSAVAGAPHILGPTPSLTINAPDSVKGEYGIGQAQFGAALTVAGVTGNIVLGTDPNDAAGASTTDACSALTNSDDLRGRIALVDRGNCTFVSKAKNAQDAGAIGLVIANNQAGNPPGMSGDDPSVTIPVVSISQVDGSQLKTQLANGLNGSIRLDPARRSGANTQGNLLLYAPSPIETGSSISHWDTSAFPNLLMEPAVNADLKHEVDLTENFFTDIGWGSRAVIETTQTVALVSDTDGNGGLTRGETIRYTVTLKNNGTGPAQNLTYSATLDPNTSLVPGSLTTTSGTASAAGGTVTVTIPSIASYATVTIVFDAVVSPATPSSVTVIETQGHITGDSIDVLTDDPATVAEGDSTRIGFASSAARRRAVRK